MALSKEKQELKKELLAVRKEHEIIRRKKIKYGKKLITIFKQMEKDGMPYLTKEEIKLFEQELKKLEK